MGTTTLPFTATTVLTLSKSVWKLGSSLSTLDQNLSWEVKSLGNECDLAYAAWKEIGSCRPPYSVDDRMWDCLATQVKEISQTMQEIELLVPNVGEQRLYSGCLGADKEQTAGFSTRVRKHTDNLHTTLLLVDTIRTHIAPCRADRGLPTKLARLQEMVEKLERIRDGTPRSERSYTEATLIQFARETILKGTTMYGASLVKSSAASDRGTEDNTAHVSEWINTLESMRRVQQLSGPSNPVSDVPSTYSSNEVRTMTTNIASPGRIVQNQQICDEFDETSDDDLEIDLAKAALNTGTRAFEAQDWAEANSLLQEGLRALQQLPKQQRAFCDTLGLQYKLAVCAYHTQEPLAAEEALKSVVEQSTSSDEQRTYIYDAAHLLSYLYVRMGQFERARSECEKALQARRRLSGKRSDVSLESMALMSHIDVLLNNRARAKVWLAMIPEPRRDVFLKIVERSLGTRVEHRLDPTSPLTHSVSEDSDFQSRLSTSSVTQHMEKRYYGPVSSIISQSSSANVRPQHGRILSDRTDSERTQSVVLTSPSSLEDKRRSRAGDDIKVDQRYSAYPEALGVMSVSPGQTREVKKTVSNAKPLSRKEVLDRIGCQPRDRIEEAVCDGDRIVFAKFLDKRTDSWRSKFRSGRRVRPERVTALHFAALFGEIEMARRLLDSNFNINEIPYGYSTSFTPLKFAIGARQVEMVEFLIASGARPSDPDSWSTLAGQLMNRSWLTKTMSEVDQDLVPGQMVAILKILLKHGFDVNAPFEASGRTLLHQAVTFWTGSYTWDSTVRITLTSFLCGQGAVPSRASSDGRTPYDMASAAGHQDLLLILDRGLNNKRLDTWSVEPVELPAESGGQV